MKIIGISGRKQSGKDTVAEILYRKLLPATTIRVAFADALKQEVAKACGVSVEYINEHKDNFRLILQGWGTDYRRKLCGEQYWTTQYLKKLLSLGNRYDYIITPDVRFLNEVQCITELGCPIIRVERATNNIDYHQSENDLNHYHFTWTIHNDGTIEDLEKKIEIYLPQIIK